MYIPKNRITTNLYTSGNEYKDVQTGEPYTGFYWTMYNGTIFTGKNPNEKPSIELIKIVVVEEIERLTEENENFQQYADNYDSEVVPGQYQNMDDITTYNTLRDTDISQTQLIPQQYYPTPTDEEYKLGVFQRYFAVKINEPIYVELSKDVFIKMKNGNPQYNYEAYTLFGMPWTIIGFDNEVFQINQNQVIIAENKISRRGLQKFLGNDFLKFLARDSGKILYSNGEDGLVLPNGKAYIGDYHVMLDGTPMTGASHGTGNNIVLTRIYS